MTNLLPCPHCGGEANYREETPGFWFVQCTNCAASTACSDEETAARLWNRRAERTCKQILTDCNDGLMPPFTAHCSACGDEWGFTPNFCPNCGARVIGGAE